MTTHATLEERLAEIGAFLQREQYATRRDTLWMHRILTRLGDEKMVEAAGNALHEEFYRTRPGRCQKCGRGFRAALSAALAAAMQMEE